MNYKEVLKCLKMPNYVSNDFYSMLFARSIGGGAAGYGELTGTPPLTFIANGENLINYRIYGASGGVGERSIPYGYQINAVVRSENLFDASIEQGTFVTTNGLEQNSATRVRSKFADSPLTAGMYTINASGADDVVVYVYDADKQYIQSASIVEWQSLPFAFTASANVYVRFAFRYSDNRSITPTDVSNITLTHVTDIPIYIGDTPLAQGEYADYGEQKVYKYVGGVLTPTDPPVPIPALPTIDGETIVDFDNTPKPSEMYVKYPK